MGVFEFLKGLAGRAKSFVSNAWDKGKSFVNNIVGSGGGQQVWDLVKSGAKNVINEVLGGSPQEVYRDFQKDASGALDGIKQGNFDGAGALFDKGRQTLMDTKDRATAKLTEIRDGFSAAKDIVSSKFNDVRANFDTFASRFR
jgi:hypothetical protein